LTPSGTSGLYYAISSTKVRMNLVDAFASAASRNAQKTALFWGHAEYSYEQLWRQSLWVQGRLGEEHGVRRGDRIGLLLRNRPEFVAALFGSLATGASVVPINNFLKPEEVEFVVRDAGIRVLISQEDLRPVTEEVQSHIEGLRVLMADGIPAEGCGGDGRGCGLGVGEADLAVIIYTSGTTGRPKGAMLTHGNLLHNVESCRQVLAAVDHDRFVLLLPMFHSFMLCVCVFLPLIVGGSIVLVRSLHPPKNVLFEIAHRQATILPAIPQFFRALLDPSVPTDLPLRLCISGAAPLPVQTLTDFNRKFPFPLLEGYGLSEASPVVSFTPISGPWKAGSIGLPIANVEVTVQDDSGRVLPPGEVGEICVRGGNVMTGYWNQPEETAKALRNGWLLTGDVGYQDADGFSYITDRKKDMLLVHGMNVYPREIEEALYAHPASLEAAVIGVPDKARGEEIKACVALREGHALTAQELIDYCRERMARYKVPRLVEFVTELPKGPTGKILKRELS